MLLVTVAVATLVACLTVGTATGGAAQSRGSGRAQVIASLQRVASILARDDQLVSVAQVLPTARAVRHGAEIPAPSKLLRTERTAIADRRDDSRLIGTLSSYERRLRGVPPRPEIAALERAVELLGRPARLAPGSAERALSQDASAVRRNAARDRSSTSHRLAASAVATGPPSGPPAVVSLGDSYISGEGGRWAGNNHDGLIYLRSADTGSDAQFPPGRNSEQIAGCHRSRSAEIGNFTRQRSAISENLACSGATTSTVETATRSSPGFQSSQLQRPPRAGSHADDYARTHDVRMVVLSIGGNDFHFSSVIKTCLADFLLSSACKQDP